MAVSSRVWHAAVVSCTSLVARAALHKLITIMVTGGWQGSASVSGVKTRRSSSAAQRQGDLLLRYLLEDFKIVLPCLFWEALEMVGSGQSLRRYHHDGGARQHGRGQVCA